MHLGVGTGTTTKRMEEREEERKARKLRWRGKSDRRGRNDCDECFRIRRIYDFKKPICGRCKKAGIDCTWIHKEEGKRNPVDKSGYCDRYIKRRFTCDLEKPKCGKCGEGTRVKCAWERAEKKARQEQEQEAAERVRRG